jgi:hypothetical protein
VYCLARKNERRRRGSLFNFLVAVVSVASALYTLSIGFPGTAMFLFVLAGMCALWASWDNLVYRQA